MGQVTIIISGHYRALNARHFLPHKWPENRRPPQIKSDLRRIKNHQLSPKTENLVKSQPFHPFWLCNNPHDEEDNKQDHWIQTPL
jgi:hypothetical protein